ncbi:MAG: 4Fe-4S binding protein [Deltaproteobacteria bacterium]|nr:4Fe-4S binding protein [Deltaproteobacteria bacterium]
MSRRTALIIIITALVVALAAPLALRLVPRSAQTRVITFTAQRYGYTPARITVNKGDKVVLKPTSKDVTHGFLLDGYDVDAILKQQGVTYLKYVWTDDQGKAHADWDKVKQIEFTADKAGKFTYRCTQTCGSLHPFMVGELIVQDNTPYHYAVALSLWIVFSLLLWTGVGGWRPPSSKRVDLLAKLPWLGRLVKARSFQFWLLLINLMVFYLFILSALWGSPVGNRNIAIIFVWIFWWTALKAVMLPLGGRVWCLMCPLPAPAEWLARMRLTSVRYIQKPLRRLHHRFLGLNLDWPKRLTNGWLQNALFLVLISFGIILITRPVATAILFLFILGATLVLSFIYRGRAFCRFLCPVGGFLGTYSMAACSELRPVDTDVCKKHREKCCLVGGEGGWACPWGRYTGGLGRNNYCGLCTECIKSCPKDNVSIFLRPFGSDLRLKGYDEAYNVLIMIMVALVFSVTMLGPWLWIKQAANVTESRHLVPFLLYVGSVLSLAVVIFPGLFFGASWLGRRWSGIDAPFKETALRLAYVFIPLGIFAWIAFSLPQVMINYNYVLAVLSDPLGLGWNLFGTAYLPFDPLWPRSIPYIQGVLLLSGLYLGLKRGLASLGPAAPTPGERLKAMLPTAALTLIVVNVFLRLYMA